MEPVIGPFRFYYDAWGELNSCRQIGMSVGPIPFTAIVEYSRLYEVGDFEEFLFLIRKMDSVFLPLVNKADDGKKATTDGGNGPKRNSN